MSLAMLRKKTMKRTNDRDGLGQSKKRASEGIG